MSSVIYGLNSGSLLAPAEADSDHQLQEPVPSIQSNKVYGRRSKHQCQVTIQASEMEETGKIALV